VPKSLKTNQSAWTKVFRRIVRQLEQDADVRRVVGVQNIRSWKGEPGDKAPFEPSSSAPVVRLTPMPRGVDWYSEDAQAGDLTVAVEIAVQSLCIDDVTDLWDLLVAALSAAHDPFTRDLVAAGAETGQVVFSDPAFDPQPAAKPEGQFFAAGSFRLKVIRPD
jgi:hypothetical protein